MSSIQASNVRSVSRIEGAHVKGGESQSIIDHQKRQTIGLLLNSAFLRQDPSKNPKDPYDRVPTPGIRQNQMTPQSPELLQEFQVMPRIILGMQPERFEK